MDKVVFKRKKLLPFHQSTKNRVIFMILNIYLIIGVSCLLATLIYLMGHLNQADGIIKYCIPGFILGLSSAIIYFIGYQSMNSERQDKKHRYI